MGTTMMNTDGNDGTMMVVNDGKFLGKDAKFGAFGEAEVYTAPRAKALAKALGGKVMKFSDAMMLHIGG